VPASVATDLPDAPLADARPSRMNLSHLLTRRYWLDAPHGRVAIGAWPLLIGRNHDCNIVLEQPEISRHHLLVRLGGNGAEMLPLGRGPVRLNGTRCSSLSTLAAGDRIEVGEWCFVVGEGEAEYSARSSEVAWCLERQSGLLHLVVASPFRVGGGAVDDLIIDGWEPTVFSLTLGRGAPSLTALRRGVACGHDLEEGERVVVAEDAVITYQSQSFHLRAKAARAEAETFTAARPRHAVVVMLEFLPRGGRLTLEIGGRLHVALLADRRCDLVASLLQPPSPFVAGDVVPEETVCEHVWPGERNGRTELNSLLYRLRHGLADEGIDPTLLFERVGGGLRFCLAAGARVIVR
jgi:hypothetical protein